VGVGLCEQMTNVERQKMLPKLPSTIGKKGVCIDPVTKHKDKFEVIDEIRIAQSDLPSKIILLQKVRFARGVTELRLAYYIIGKKQGMKGKWVFGQYATFIPIQDFHELMRLAAERKGFYDEL